MTNMQPFRIALLAGCLAVGSIAAAQAARPTPPTRPADGPGAPAFTAIAGKGANAPIDKNGDFLIGPDYAPAPELEPVESVPHGKVQQFAMDSKDSKFYPGIARDVFGTVDPNNPKTLIVETHAQPYQRTITVYVPAQYKRGTKAPFIVMHDGPKIGEARRDAAAHVLDNLIAQKRVPAMIAIMIQNGGGDAQGSQRGLEYDTMSGKFAEFIEAEVLPAVEKNDEREAHAQARWPRGHGLQLGRGGGAHDGLVPPRVVPPRHQLLGHVREPAVAVQPGDAGRRLGLSRVDHRERQAEAHPHLDARGRPRPLQPERHARRHARLGGG